jgi:predicted dehydrogenase
MNQTIKVGIIGGGWPGEAHARAYQEAAGFTVRAVADLIPARREHLQTLYKAVAFPDARELLLDKQIDAVSLCVPTDQHAALAIAALRAGKHVLCEMPPALDLKQAKQMQAAADKHGKILMYATRRRFGAHEQAAKQAIAKGYAGQIYHARATWMRSRGIPTGTGWYTQKARSGGGALMDLGAQMLDLAWFLLDQPRGATVFALNHQRFKESAPPDQLYDVEDSAFALLRFKGGASLELACSWAINQPPQQDGALCRIYGSTGAIDVYTPQGPVLYRKFDARGQAQATPLKGPKLVHHAAMVRQFRQAINGQTSVECGAEQGVELMRLIEAIYKSAATGKSIELK